MFIFEDPPGYSLGIFSSSANSFLPEPPKYIYQSFQIFIWCEFLVYLTRNKQIGLNIKENENSKLKIGMIF